VSGVSPTQLSLRRLRSEGWAVDVCERWVPMGGGAQSVRRDLFGLLDLVALRAGETMGVQTTTASNYLSRVKKLTDDEHRPTLDLLLEAGWLVAVHGWRLTDAKGHACTHRPAHCACRWDLHHESLMGARL
jgi:hypothetical protein